MLITEIRPISFFLRAFLSGMFLGRLVRIRVMFPDIGNSVVFVGCGLLRYPGEKSIVKPNATAKELQLPGGLTIHL